MSLTTVIFKREEFLYYYNCSSYDVNSIPVEARRNVLRAIIIFVIAFLAEALYLPCIWALWRMCVEVRQERVCHRLMLYLGIVECYGLFNTGFIASYFVYHGIVYCMMPVFTYVICCIATSLFCAENTVVLILALNRCIIMFDPGLAHRLFDGFGAQCFWLMLPTVAAVLFISFTPPDIFNVIEGSAFFNPHRPYLPDQPYYHNIVNTAYNWAVVIAIVVIYTVFGALFYAKHAGRQEKLSRKLHAELSTSLQVLVTCFFIASTCVGFLYTELLERFSFIVYAAYIMYQGSPAIVYLSLNRSMRRRVLRHPWLIRLLSRDPRRLQMDKLTALPTVSNVYNNNNESNRFTTRTVFGNLLPHN